MNADNYIKGQLAALAIRDGFHHGGVENMLAVANVIRNRVAQGWSGGDWMDVLDAEDAYIGTEYAPEKTKLRDMNVRVFLQRLDDVYTGSEEDNTEGAVFYCELHKVTRQWFRENVLQRRADHPMVAQVGQVAFFK